MSTIQSGVVWYELLTRDPEAATAFYGQVLDWTFPRPARGSDIRLIEIHGDAIGAVGILPAWAEEKGLKAGWRFHLGVLDVHAAAAAVVAGGGAAITPPEDVLGLGPFALMEDPEGAFFYLAAPTSDGPATAHLPGVPGHGAWHELHARDAAAAFAFYAAAFGWTADGVVDLGPEIGLCRLFAVNEIQTGAIFADARAERPSWTLYFETRDIDRAAERALSAGASLLLGPQEVQGGAFILNALDPQGALFALTGPRV